MIITAEEATVVSTRTPAPQTPTSTDADLARIHALVDMLGGVSDPRKAQGIRHRIGRARISPGARANSIMLVGSGCRETWAGYAQ
jgi:hypothetical protein